MLEFVIGVILGILIHRIWVRLVVMFTLSQLRSQGIDIDALLDSKDTDTDSDQPALVEGRLEEHQGQYYLYRKDNDEFIAQGRNRKELDQLIQQRLPNQNVVIHMEASVREKFLAQAD